jgi:hypothetical protein
MVQGGQDEITLSNTHQPTQPQFVIRVNTKDREISFTYLAEVENRNVKRQVDSARLQLALAGGCSFALISSESGLSIVGGNLPPNPNVTVHNELLEFLEQVLLIQNRTRTPITVPARDIELEEARGIYEMAERLRKGKITGTINSLSFTVNREGAKNLLTSAHKPDEVLTVTEEQIWNVLGTEVRVGRAVTIVRGMRLAQKALQNIQEGLANDTAAESFEVQYEPAGKDTEVILLYPDCGTDAESAAMREQLDAASIVGG